MADKKVGAPSSIDISLRFRPLPPKCRQVDYEVDPEGRGVLFKVDKDLQAEIVNNARDEYHFKFDHIFDQTAQQPEVFDSVAADAVLAALDGYNSTVFAYGQTGSGKTFTITGGAERYNDRGLIPRALSMIFSETSKRTDRQHQIYISYLELYNEIGYDLLDQSKETTVLEDLPRVTLAEDEDGAIHMRNLGANLAANEEEALNLLFVGDTNRMIAETPMNLASSRSHCIFTVTIESRPVGGDVIRRSKFNLVDLAGSERVAKTGAEGTLLKEAKYINLSLHYLEQVIVSLSERKSHIPYRNSVMTSVLRDSLGGNCKTAMIATVSADRRNLNEAISTCRFAQRVAMVKNDAQVNEHLDPQLVIRRLKAENRELREQIAMLENGGADGGEGAALAELSEDEQIRLRQVVQQWLQDGDPAAKLVVGSWAKTVGAFKILKELVLSGSGAGAQTNSQALPAGVAGPQVPPADRATVEALTLQLSQRDNEIAILVGMLNKRNGKPSSDAALAAHGGAQVDQGPAAVSALSSTTTAGSSGVPGGVDFAAKFAAAGYVPAGSAEATTAGSAASMPLSDLSGTSGMYQEEESHAPVDLSLLKDRNQAFEAFRKSYRRHEAIEENKAILKGKYADAKALAATINSSKGRINALKSKIEQLRKERALQGLTDSADGDLTSSTEGAEEAQAMKEIETEKQSYKEAYGRLKGLKAEIEHLQLMLEKSRKRLQKDFEGWYEATLRQAIAREKAQAVRNGRRGGERAAVTQQDVALGVAETPRTAAARKAAGATLTGNPEADADIIAFYKAREQLIANTGSEGGSRK